MDGHLKFSPLDLDPMVNIKTTFMVLKCVHKFQESIFIIESKSNGSSLKSPSMVELPIYIDVGG
ncbi:hypothetical protein Scep_022154 [Stephania cephalantha]|uniref:Uncharacterized protein n=1 Tax=Stephania cephalantha TaxID=152367 RepID=A0AAP0F4U0_9MAGN